MTAMTHRINVESSRGSTVHATDPDPKWSLPALGQFTYSETLCGRRIPRHGAWTETRSPVTCTRCSVVLEAADKTARYVDSLPEGYRWATEEETERWEELPDLAYVRVPGNDDARDLAVPDAPKEA